MTAAHYANGTIVALCISDVHWCHTPPGLRKDEHDWYEAQDNQLYELAGLWESLEYPRILVAGDLFDKWNPPLQLVHFISKRIHHHFGAQSLIAIPGQHDLPNHSLGSINRSGYGMLHETKAIFDLTSLGGMGYKYAGYDVWVQAFPWGVEPGPCLTEGGFDIKIAMSHRYAYDNPSQAYTGAPETGHHTLHGFSGFDVVHYGDNHIRWKAINQGVSVVNPGTFYKRHKPDIEAVCGPYAIWADGKATSIELSTKSNVLTLSDDIPDAIVPSTHEVMQRLSSLSGDCSDVYGQISRWCDRYPKPLKESILSLAKENEDGSR